MTDPEVRSSEWNALIRLTHDGEEIFVGEIRTGHEVQLADGWGLEVLWIRHHLWDRDAPK